MKSYERENCCAKRSVLEKILIVVIVLLVCLLIALFCVFVLYVKGRKNEHFQTTTTPTIIGAMASRQKKETEICMTSDCIKASSQIIDFIDHTKNPCDNFFEFACGTFFKKSIESTEILSLGKLEEITNRQVDSLIIQPSTGRVPKPLQLQRKYYQECIKNQNGEENTQALLNLLKELGDWPVLHGRFWDERKFDWISSIVLCRQLGFEFDHFFKVGVTNGAYNRTGTFLLSISPPATLDLPYGPIRDHYSELMANISIELEAPPYLAQNEFTRVLQFQEAIKTYAADEAQSGSEAVVTISRLEQTFPSIPWIDFLNNITKSSIRVDRKTLISFRADRYLRNLLNLIVQTPKSTQANYVAWKIIENFVHYLKASIQNAYERFSFGVNPNLAFVNSNKHSFCLETAKSYFPSVAELAYVRTHLQTTKRTQVKELVTNVKKELMYRIRTSNWLDSNAKNLAIDHLISMDHLVGVSDLGYNGPFDTIVDMDDFELDTDDMIGMVTKLRTKLQDNYFKRANQKFETFAKKEIEKSSILGFNTFYLAAVNALVVPAPSLQGVTYNQRPQYMNYAALGGVVGHELARAFLLHRRRSGETMEKYEDKIQCLLEDQKYIVQNNTIEGTLASLMGPDLAYQAYKQWSRDHRGPEPILPGLNYTQNQLFWIMTGAFSCYQPMLQPHNFQLNPSFAVLFNVKNSDYFASDFNCPVGSKMNPEKKCRIL